MLEEMENLRLACDPRWRAEVARAREMARDEESVRAAQERGDLVPLEKLQVELASSAEARGASDTDGDLPGQPHICRREGAAEAAKRGAGILELLRQLAQKPRGQGCVKMKGRSDQYRTRVGEYRIRYLIKDDIPRAHQVC